jgi:predicted nucleotidyltransferase
MTPKFMQLLEQCILDGVVIGHTQAYKHNDVPTKSDINMFIVQEVMNEIHEWFEFDVTLKEKNDES